MHTHTIEVAVHVQLMEMLADIKKFEDTEVLIASCLEPFDGCYLNDLEDFEHDVSIEYLGEVLFYKLDKMFTDSNIIMAKLEIGETPLRTYIVANTP